MVRKILAKRAARAYAAQLPEWLAEHYALTENYTIGQIRTAVRALRLNPDYIVLAFAAFLPVTAFESVASELPLKLSYDEARAMFREARSLVSA